MSTGARFRTLSPGGELKTIFGVLAATVGIVVYVFVVGWIVELVRLSAARLPASAGVAALGSRQLFGVGLVSTLLMAAVFAVACAIAYFSSRRRWDVQGQDWHDIVRKGGVGNAAAAPNAAVERRRRQWRHATVKAQRARAVATRSKGWPLGLVHRSAELVVTGNKRRAEKLPPEHPRPLETAPLGDFAVRIIAGFNIMVLSALIGLGVARGVGTAVPIARWVGVLIGVGVFFGIRWVLTRVSPLVFDARIHGLAWALVAVAPQRRSA